MINLNEFCDRKTGTKDDQNKIRLADELNQLNSISFLTSSYVF